MADTAYLAIADILAIHDDLIKEFGGIAGIREEMLLDSASMRPHMAAHYDNADLNRQAATLVVGILKNHPFVDGNKRTAVMVGATFLLANGYTLEPREPYDFATLILTVIDEDADLAVGFVEAWFRSRIRSS